MNSKLTYISIVFLVALVASCKKDNYEPPKSQLTGRFVYKGEPIQVEYDRVPYEIYEYGFGKVAPVGTYTDAGLNTSTVISPEGTFSVLLYDGDYKLVVRPGQGPFVWPQTAGKSDSVAITVKGATTRDIDVEPYYMVRSPQFAFAAGKVTGTFKVEKIITDATRAKNIERAVLFINKTNFVSNDNNIARAEVAGAAITDPNNISLNVTVPTLTPTQNYVFARIGVKSAGVEDWIFSPVQKIQF